MSRAWYFLALVPVVVGVAISAVTFLGMIDDIEAMQRVVVPGEGQLELDAGEYVAYGETTSRVNGVAYTNTGFSARCTMVGPDGAPVALEAPTGSVTYTMGGFSGKNFFDFTIRARGTYTLSCEGGDAPGVIAVGTGVGTGIVIALLAGIGGLIAGVVTIVVVRRKRKRARAAQPAAA